MAEPEEIVCDVLVVGSGAGGLSTAVAAANAGLNVVVVEKEPVFGGTTARSGGVLWVPGNRVNASEGITDSAAAARTYLEHEAGNFFDRAKVDTFLANAPEMVDFFEEQTSVKFMPNAAFPDYHPDAPGAVTGGRSIVAASVQGQELGSHIKDLRPPLKEITFVGMAFNASKEVQHFFKATSSLTSFVYVFRRLLSHSFEMVRYGRAMRLTNGNALVARLAKSAFDLGIPIHVDTPAVRLLGPPGEVQGAMVRMKGVETRITTRKGVVLATGGFPLDEERRKQLFPHAPTGKEHYSPAPPGNTGDGLRLGRSAGAETEDGLPNAAAWIPVSRVPYRNGTVGHFPHLIDRYKPGIIAVLKNGKRFTNEADSYHDFGKAMARACLGQSETAAWLICDHKALRKYGMGFVKPFPIPLVHHLASGYLLRGRTLAELARKAGIDPDHLTQTVARFNGPAMAGLDPDFGKGTTAYNRFLGDAEHKPNACVAPLDKAPYYAIKVVPGDLGTFAGLKTNRHAQVTTHSGDIVKGLYAVGNDMASVMGGNYPGGGITLGPAMTFGYVAARHMAGLPISELPENETQTEEV